MRNIVAVPMAKISTFLAMALAGCGAISANAQEYRILPSAANAAVKQFDKPHMVIAPDKRSMDAPLAVFLPGSGGWGAGAPRMLNYISSRGYRAIGLSFVTLPSISQVCPRDPDPDCAADFREMRTYGTGDFTKRKNSYADSIVGRLVDLLKHLDAEHPEENWAQYLNGDQPRWDRLVLTGQSQGGGMAAFIAKEHLVHRVVMFSPGWDITGKPARLASWWSDPSVTPLDRYYGGFHKKEKTARLLDQVYSALRVPEDYIVRFDLEMTKERAERAKRRESPNPYHTQGIGDPRYTKDWDMLFGKAD